MNQNRCFRTTVLAVTAFLAFTVSAVSPDVWDYPEVSAGELRWQIDPAHGGAELRIVRPDGKVVARSVPAGEQEIGYSLAEDGQPEGTYLWELSLAPRLTAEQRSELELARREGAEPALAEVKGQRAQGSFRIMEGEIHGISGDPSQEAGAVQRADEGGYSPQDTVAGELVVDGSLCVGVDCVEPENYGHDTIRLKENNLRIAFIDTSTSSFPAGDWQLRANSSPNGGADLFAIDWLGTDSDGSANDTPVSTPLRIDGGASGDALRIINNGNVGLGTPSPVHKLHLRDGNSPAIRLEQDDSSGFTAQTWDVSGNEANFFIRDVNNGSLLPLRIRPGAPTSSIDISSSGNVGIGTASPSARLHVVGDARIDGALYQLSSRAAKTAFDRLDASALLDQIEKLDLGFWRYKGKADAERHFGPTAEDFYAAFGLGGNERHISVSDMAGIALGATQALQEEIRERDEKIAELTQRLERLEAAFDAEAAR